MNTQDVASARIRRLTNGRELWQIELGCGCSAIRPVRNTEGAPKTLRCKRHPKNDSRRKS